MSALLFIGGSFADDSEEHRFARWGFKGARVSNAATASVSAAPTMLNDGDEVTVSFSVDDPSYTSLFLAAVSPSNTDLTLTAPVEYYELKASSGEVSFELVNMRADYSFVLFNGTLSSPMELGRSNTVTFENLNAPLRPRLMHTQDVTEMQLVWSSLSADKHPRVVYYSSDDPSATTTLPATSYTYSVHDLCGPPATTVGWRDPGRATSFVFKLTSNAKYTVYRHLFI